MNTLLPRTRQPYGLQKVVCAVVAMTSLALTAPAASQRTIAQGPPNAVSAGNAPFATETTLPDWLKAGWTDEDRRFVKLRAAKDDTFVPQSFSFEHTRVILERGRKLLDRLRNKVDSERLEPLAAQIPRLGAELGRLEFSENVSDEIRRDLHFKARQIVRQIAFTNPLLNFDKILFIKRHHPGGVFHMCDQFYGFNAKPGGGLYVLSDPFGTNPTLTDLLENAFVENGRRDGRRLTPGAFLSPELSFDGKTILFAYTEAKGKDLEWSPRASWHIFKIGADGTGLQQLTDGPTDDFDPCFLPNGRVVFVTERRGGYLRCGRHCPTYAMFSMNDDGSDIRCFSFHETHEWHPSVNNDGMVVYTRWDYVDRDTNVAHHIWTCYPDGRDPRSVHGNYPAKREGRPWMEMSIRAVPGSDKYVATTGAHHGNAFGSLVMIDPNVEDDNAMAQLTRLTPDAIFPEAECPSNKIRENMFYGTAWPLSEDDYLCAYAPDAKTHGIYWIDRFGNRELLYRDPEIPCMSPIPMRARPMPPVIPSQTEIVSETKPPDKKETIAVLNIYSGDFEWPAGEKVAALRIIQVLPKTTPPPNEPRIGVADQTNARAVLGTVPVEPDGSAYFEAPAGKLVYFQALDKDGLAIQSMRSGTYIQPGENMTCQGCHEPKHRTPPTLGKMPMAVHRPPSKIAPPVDGANPFNYVRLVQPVLDRNCVQCHENRNALDLAGKIEGKNGWTRSYNNLAGKYGFYFHVRNGAINTGVHGGVRTVPGEFGARAAPLRKYMDDDHYGVKLSKEDYRRLSLWLDCNSEFYGSYEDTEAQARGEIVHPTLN